MLHERNCIVSLLLLTVICFVDGTYYVSPKKEDFYTAMHECDKKGWKLLDGQPVGQELAELMLGQKLEAVWIAVTRKEVFWQWTDEEPYDGFNGEASNHHCALLKFNGEVVSSTCIAQQAGFVCQIRDHLSCPPKFTCLTMNGTKLFIDCSSNDWYASRFKCRRYQGDLLHLRELSVTNKVAHFMEHQTKCQQVFIGLFKEKWMHVEPQNDGHIIYETHWDSGQPAFAFGKSCVELVLNAKGGILWRTQSCTHRNHFICWDGKAVQPTDKTTSKSGPSAKPTQEKENSGKVQMPKTGLQWLFLLFIVPAFAIGGVLFCIFRYLFGRNKNRKSGKITYKSSYHRVHVEEAESSKPANEKNTQTNDYSQHQLEALGVRPVTSSDEESQKQISLPIRVLLLGNKTRKCKLGNIVQLWPQETDIMNADRKPDLDDFLEAKLFIAAYKHICGEKADNFSGISVTFAAIYDDEETPRHHTNTLASMFAELMKDNPGFHIIYYNHGRQAFDSNITALLQKLKNKCITVTNDSSDDSVIRVRNANKGCTDPSHSYVDFEVVSSPSSSEPAPWNGAVRTTALIAYILLTVFKYAGDLSGSIIASAQTSEGMKDMLKTIFMKDCTMDGPVLLNPELNLSAEIVDKLRHYRSSL